MTDDTQSAPQGSSRDVPQTSESTVTTQTTLAQQFATDYAKGVVPAALEALKLVKRNTKRIAMLALAVSTPHQALYLFGLGDPHTALEIAAGVFFAVLIPIVFDLGMITMLAVTQTVGIAKQAKRRAMVVLALLVSVSVAVNMVAPGPLALRVLTGLTAATLAAVEWVSSAIAPDFSELENVETSAAPTPGTKSSVRSDAAKRGAATRAANKVQADAEKAERLELRRIARMEKQMREAFDTTIAPVSPAPGEAAAYL